MKKISLYIIICFYLLKTYAAPVYNASISVPTTSCIGQNISIMNTTNIPISQRPKHTYEWKLSKVVGFNQVTTSTPLTPISGLADKPCGIQIYNDGSNWFGFVGNNSTNTESIQGAPLQRLNFGSNLLSLPTVTNLPNFNIIYSPKAVRIVKENNIWYGIVVSDGCFVNGYTPAVAIISFGNSLSNIPTLVSNLSSLDGAISPDETITGLCLLKDRDNDIAFVSTSSYEGYHQSKIIKINFSNAITNTPTVNIIYQKSSRVVTAMDFIKYNAEWYGIVGEKIYRSSGDIYEISSIKIGNDLRVNSIPIDIGTFGINLEQDYILAYKECEDVNFYSANHMFNVPQNSSINNYSFLPNFSNPNNIHTNNNNPNISFNKINSLSQFIDNNNKRYLFVTDEGNNSIHRIEINNYSIISTSYRPTNFSILETGSYYITLTLDKGTLTESQMCKSMNIIDLQNPIPISSCSGNNIRISNNIQGSEKEIPLKNNSELNIVPSSCYCFGSVFYLSVQNPQSGVTYTWMGPNGFNASGINVPVIAQTSGNYTVTATNFCGTKSATVNVVITKISPVITSNNTYVCPGIKTHLDGGTGYDSYKWLNLQTNEEIATTQIIDIEHPGTYQLTVTKNGCSGSSSIVINNKCPLTYMPYFSLGPCANGNINSGSIKADIEHQIGGSNNLYYTLYVDEYYNNNIETQCLNIVRSNSTGIFTGLPKGDYVIKVCDQAVDYPNVCLETKIFLDPLNSSIGLPSPMYICPDKTTEIKIEPLYTSVIWSNECGNLLPESEVAISQFNHLFKPGAGGWHTIISTTPGGCVLKDNVFMYDFNAPTLKLRLLDSILQTGSSKIEDVWMPDVSTMQWNTAQEITNFLNRSRYAQGKVGIYKGLKTYDYLDQRVITEKPITLQVKTEYDGHFNQMPFFNWQHPKFSLTASTAKWINTNTMTKYNPASFELENKDILDNKSAALYGYGGKLEIAVAGNAAYTEIGFENFEEYNTTDFNSTSLTPTSTHQLNNQTGNLDILKNIIQASYFQYKEHQIIDAYKDKAIVAISNDFPCKENVMVLDVFARSVPRNETDERKELLTENVEANIKISPCNDSKTVMLEFDYSKYKNEFPTSDNCTYWYGVAYQKIPVNYTSNLIFPISLTTSTAHSGKNSVLITANTGIEIPQKNLRLQGGKEYQISAWIYIPNHSEDLPSELKNFINVNNIGIIIKMNPGVETSVLKPTGSVINGWQRVYANFKTPDGIEETILKFSNTYDMYLDDIRIQPANATMQTYVYDVENYKLRAVLDQNNYATFYKYDDAGNLFLLQKETAEGVKTIQLSSSYIHPTKE